MKPRWTTCIAIVIFALSSSLAFATPRGGPGGGPGGGTGGGSACGSICRFIYGTCEIPSGDPDVPPLRDPFCERNLRTCIAVCSGGSGGGILLTAAPAGRPDVGQCMVPIDATCPSESSSPTGSAGLSGSVEL
jgi:hypothetical protein